MVREDKQCTIRYLYISDNCHKQNNKTGSHCVNGYVTLEGGEKQRVCRIFFFPMLQFILLLHGLQSIC